jgi:tape measure domain-containing protein
MATIASLNVAIGTSIADLQKGLRQAEREFRSSGAKLARAGNELSQTLSLSLGAFGIGAIKSAGDIEQLSLSLQTTMGAAGRSVGDAKTELDALRKIALAPGLDFDQAVKGSLRLQGVGFSAEQARKTLQEFGNAVSVSGGDPTSLDRVTVQLAQITGKGKVLNEDLMILKENMPSVSAAMVKAFGTADAEGIRKLGLSGKEFVSKLTEELSKIPRATGGINNALVNMASSIKESMGKIGMDIAKAIDLVGLSEKFSAAVGTMSEGFASLSDGTKQFIVYTGLAAVAIGPLFKGMGAIKLLASEVVGGMQGMVSAFGALSGSVIQSATYFGGVLRTIAAFSAAAIAVTGVVAVLGLGIYAMANQFDAAEFASSEFNKAQKNIIEDTAKERGEVAASFAVLKSDTSTRMQKLDAMKLLQNNYPTYLRGIDLEKATVSQLTEIQNGLNASILRGVAERQKVAAVTAIYEKQAQMMLRVQQLQGGGSVTVGESTQVNTGEMIKAGGVRAAVMAKLQKQIEQLGQEANTTAAQFDKAFGTQARAIDLTLKAEYDARDAYEAGKDSLVDLTAKTDKHVLSEKELAKAKRERLKLEKEVNKSLEADIEQLLLMNQLEEEAAKRNATPVIPFGSQLRTSNDQNKAIAPVSMQKDTVKKYADEVKGQMLSIQMAINGVKEPMEQLDALFQKGSINFSEAWKLASAEIQASGDVMTKAALAATMSAQDYAEKGGSSFKELGKAALAGGAKVVRSYIMQGVAAAVSKALTTVPFPFNVIAGGIAGAAAGTLFNKLLGALKIPAMAKGGLVSGPTIAMVGEYAGASNNPEVIAPLNKLQEMMGGGSVELSHEIRISGNDLLILIENAQKRKNRVTGR